jgi:hypothetical protein
MLQKWRTLRRHALRTASRGKLYQINMVAIWVMAHPECNAFPKVKQLKRSFNVNPPQKRFDPREIEKATLQYHCGGGKRVRRCRKPTGLTPIGAVLAWSR